MQIIGLTGGIGTGKSTACRLLRENFPEVPIIDADYLSHEATRPGRLPYILLKFLVLPRDCFDGESGELLRAQLASLIFAKTERSRLLRKIVERCIHPWVIWRMFIAISWYWLCGHCRIVLDIPLLFEARLQWMCTRTILIDTTNEDLQILRILSRNPAWTEEEARNRISAQYSMQQKRKLAQITINNDGEISDLRQRLIETFNEEPSKFLHLSLYLFLPCLAALVLTLVIIRHAHF